MLANSLHNGSSSRAGDTERHTAFFHIRTRDIHLDSWNTFQRIKLLCSLCIRLRRITTNIDYHIRVDIFYLRIDMFDKVIYSLILQTYAVKHSLRCLYHTWIVISLTWFQCRTLNDNTSNFLQWYEISKLQTIAKGTTGCHYRILEL